MRRYLSLSKSHILRLLTTRRTFLCCSGLRWVKPQMLLTAHLASLMRPSCRILLCPAHSKRRQSLIEIENGAGYSGAIISARSGDRGTNLHPNFLPDNLTNWLINSWAGLFWDRQVHVQFRRLADRNNEPASHTVCI